MPPHVHSKLSVCIKDPGPIPPGTYYIVDRQTGGLLGRLRDALSSKGDWFALYADDGQIDDQTLCDQVSRGNFRLHPKGPLGISKGCITISSLSDFQKLRALLITSPLESIPNRQLKTYGTITVN